MVPIVSAPSVKTLFVSHTPLTRYICRADSRTRRTSNIEHLSPLTMHASPQPKPKKQFSFHGLRARFMSQSQSRLELPVPPHLDELSRLYPASAPANSKDWDPSQLVDEAYPTLSPSESSATSSPSGKSLPAHPATERRPIPSVHASRYQAPEVFVPDRHRERSHSLDPWKERHEATPISFNKRNSSVADDYPSEYEIVSLQTSRANSNS